MSKLMRLSWLLAFAGGLLLAPPLKGGESVRAGWSTPGGSKRISRSRSSDPRRLGAQVYAAKHIPGAVSVDLTPGTAFGK
jgi:hypothetical protein